MRVIFLQNIKGTAQVGNIKEVSSGYARNYLIPRKLARPADIGALKMTDALIKKRELSRDKQTAWAQEVVKRVKEITLNFNEEANEDGHLYGSVDQKKIMDAMNKHGLNITENHIELPQHIKELGEHVVELKLTPDIKTSVSVSILNKSSGDKS